MPEMYSGMTLDNYRRCTYLEDGKILFDKRRDERFLSPDILWLADNLLEAANVAQFRAAQEKDTPVVISAEIPEKYANGRCPTTTPVTVDHMWIGKYRLRWGDFAALHTPEDVVKQYTAQSAMLLSEPTLTDRIASFFK